MTLHWPMMVLMITCLSSLLLTTEGLLPNPKPSFLTSRMSQDHLRREKLQFTIQQSRPLIECKSQLDPSSEADTDEDEEYDTTIQEKSKESSGFDSATKNTEKPLQVNDAPSTIPPQSLSIPAVLFVTVLFVSFWPLLALLRSTTSPIDGFDIDMFMALKGIIDTDPMADTDPNTILELPSLSPAEQLVGAIFGPPQ